MLKSTFRTWWRGLAALMLAVAFAGAGGAAAQVAETSPKVQPAVDGVLAAFATHSLVGLGEHHALAQEGDFYNALIGDPRFAREVGNVVVEFGSAAHQDTLDRYLAGEEVPYPALREVWTDLVGVYPAMVWTMYADFFAQVRRVNLGLPAGQRIKVWLGDPGIDWSHVKTPEDMRGLSRGRDAIAVALIEREVLARGKKALVIYGFPHFQDFELHESGVQPVESIGVLLARKHPGALFTVQGYAGLPDHGCAARLEDRIRDWPRASLASPVKGTWLATAMYGPQCHGLPYVLRPPGTPEPVFTGEALGRMEKAVRDGLPDGLLYLGPKNTLIRSPILPDTYSDLAYFKELSRRSEVLVGHPLDWRDWTARAANVEYYEIY
jgi:hypothetical protein